MWPPLRMPSPRITIGTHFSGLETPSQSLKAMGFHAILRFAADADAQCREFIKVNFQASQIDGDVMAVDMASLPQVDVYVTGTPCPSYSRANRRAAGDSSMQGQLIYAPIRYLNTKRPKCFLFEQVSTLKTRWPKVFHKWRTQMKDAGYVVSHKRINSLYH